MDRQLFQPLLDAAFGAAKASWSAVGDDHKDRLLQFEAHAKDIVSGVLARRITPGDAIEAMKKYEIIVRQELILAGYDALDNAPNAALSMLTAALPEIVKIAATLLI